MQCLRNYFLTHRVLPHIANAGKYALSHSVVLFGVYHTTFYDHNTESTYKTLWVCSLCCNSLYAFYWDIKFDWGLGCYRYGGLREILLFPKYTYYCAYIIDFFLRFAWTLTLIPQGEDSPISPDFVLVISIMIMIMIHLFMYLFIIIFYLHLSLFLFVPISISLFFY